MTPSSAFEQLDLQLFVGGTQRAVDLASSVSQFLRKVGS